MTEQLFKTKRTEYLEPSEMQSSGEKEHVDLYAVKLLEISNKQMEKQITNWKKYVRNSNTKGIRFQQQC